MNAVTMNAEAARCFRRACEADNTLDQTIFIGLRQAWLSLAHQVEQRAQQPVRLVVPDSVGAGGSRRRRRSTETKRRKASIGRKPSSRPRRGKLAA